MMGTVPGARAPAGEAPEAQPAPPLARVLRRAAVEVAADALRRVGSSRMGSVAYDSGFAARLSPLLPGEPVAANARRYLEATQHPDGSWGSSFFVLHDRVLSTLSAVAGLVAAGVPSQDLRIARATAFVARALPRLSSEPQLVGSDLLIPPLLERWGELRLPVDSKASPYRKVGRLAQTLYGRTLYSGHPVGHLIEFTGTGADPERLAANLVVEPSGSVMCAPASTAFAIERAGRADPRLLSYLRRSANPDGGLRHFGPYELMEAAYALYALRWTGLLELPAAAGPLRMLREAWGPTGLAFSREFPAVDLDDSVLAALSLSASGTPVSPDFLDAYASAEYFLCYLADRRGAVAPNLHAIEALQALDHPRRGEFTGVALRFVRSRVRADGSFLDHYSVSPNYPTWHAIEALGGVDDALAMRAAGFLAASQRPDGSWGPAPEGPSTAEDTAYALLGLCAHARRHPGEFADEVARGAAYLLAHRYDPPLATWVAKILYSPTTMAACAVAGALASAADTLAPAGASLSPTSARLGAAFSPGKGSAPREQDRVVVREPQTRG